MFRTAVSVYLMVVTLAGPWLCCCTTARAAALFSRPAAGGPAAPAEPRHALTKQYVELLATEGVRLEFTPDGVGALADVASEVNRTTQNIGARRLHTILERVVEEVSFAGPDLAEKRVRIDGGYVRERLGEILRKEDLSRFIL